MVVGRDSGCISYNGEKMHSTNNTNRRFRSRYTVFFVFMLVLPLLENHPYQEEPSFSDPLSRAFRMIFQVIYPQTQAL